MRAYLFLSLAIASEVMATSLLNAARQPRKASSSSAVRAYLFLSLAIAAEVVATSFLNMSDGFNKWMPALFSLIGYAVAYFCLSQTLKTMQVGIAYGIWSGVGMVLISTIGAIRFRQMLDAPAIVGLALIVLGVVVINFFSGSISR